MVISSWMRFAAPADIVIHSELRLPFCIVANELRLNDRARKIRRQRRHTHTRSALRNTPGSARERIGGVARTQGPSRPWTPLHIAPWFMRFDRRVRVAGLSL